MMGNILIKEIKKEFGHQTVNSLTVKYPDGIVLDVANLPYFNISLPTRLRIANLLLSTFLGLGKSIPDYAQTTLTDNWNERGKND